jgi:hypothetical protein
MVDAEVPGIVDEDGHLDIDSSNARFDSSSRMSCGACNHSGWAGDFEGHDWAQIERRLGFGQEEEP